MTAPRSGNPNGAENGTPWPKGVSGNPGGFTKERRRSVARFRKMCRKYTKQALAALVAALSEPGERVPAAKVLLEYAYGKPDAALMDAAERRAVPTPEEAAAASARLRAH